MALCILTLQLSVLNFLQCLNPKEKGKKIYVGTKRARVMRGQVNSRSLCCLDLFPTYFTMICPVFMSRLIREKKTIGKFDQFVFQNKMEMACTRSHQVILGQHLLLPMFLYCISISRTTLSVPCKANEIKKYLRIPVLKRKAQVRSGQMEVTTLYSHLCSPALQFAI